MSIITDLMKSIRDDATINAFFTTNYGKTPKHFLGYNRSATAEELPCLSYVLVNSNIKDKPPSDWGISILVQLDDARLLDIDLNEIATGAVVTGDVQIFSGMILTEAIHALITNFLINNRTLPDGAVVFPDFRIKTDMALRYPRFESEIRVTIQSINYYKRTA